MIWYLLAGLTIAFIFTDGFGIFRKIARENAAKAAALAGAGADEPLNKAEERGKGIMTYEEEREIYRKTRDLWEACQKRARESGKEFYCKNDRYCLNEFFRGGCINQDIKDVLFGLSERCAQNIFPYDEIDYEEQRKSTKWPPHSRSKAKPKERK